MKRLWKRVSNPDEDRNVYESGDDRVVFSAGGADWTWDVDTKCTSSRLTNTTIRNVIDAYVDAGLSQHDYDGGYEEATRELMA